MRLITGVSLVLLLSGPDAMKTLYDYITQNTHFGPESVFSSSTENQVNNLSNFIFGFSAGNDKGKLYIRFLDLNTVSRIWISTGDRLCLSCVITIVCLT